MAFSEFHMVSARKPARSRNCGWASGLYVLRPTSNFLSITEFKKQVMGATLFWGSSFHYNLNIWIWFPYPRGFWAGWYPTTLYSISTAAGNKTTPSTVTALNEPTPDARTMFQVLSTRDAGVYLGPVQCACDSCRWGFDLNTTISIVSVSIVTELDLNCFSRQFRAKDPTICQLEICININK